MFRVLKEKLGENFNPFISEKVTLVPGDITFENLGVNDPNLVEEMRKEVDIVVNLAATTNFDDRYGLLFSFHFILFWFLSTATIFIDLFS